MYTNKIYEMRHLILTWCEGQIIQKILLGGLKGFCIQGCISNISLASLFSEYAPWHPWLALITETFADPPLQSVGLFSDQDIEKA